MDELRLIETADELDELGPAWEALAADGGSPMQRHAWARAFAAAFGIEYELKVLVLGSGTDIAAVAPLATRRDGITRLELVAGEAISEPGDFAYRDPGALDLLAAGVADMGLPMLLGRVAAESPTGEALRRAFGRRTIFYTPRGRPVPVDPAGRGLAGPRAEVQLGSPLGPPPRPAARGEGRRGHRRGARAPAGRSSLRSSRRSSGSRPPAGRAVRAPRSRATCCGREFFTEFAAGAADAGILRLAFLRIAGRTAAVQLAVECGGRFWLLKVGYDEEFKRSSPGTLLMLETVRHAAALGLESYEFLGTVESWTRVWTEHERACVALRAYPPRPGGLAAAALDAGRFARRGRRATEA